MTSLCHTDVVSTPRTSPRAAGSLPRLLYVEDETATAAMVVEVLSDEQVAGVLTYVRRSWGHEATAVTPGVVQSIRDWNQAKRDGWTEKELMRIR